MTPPDPKEPERPVATYKPRWPDHNPMHHHVTESGIYHGEFNHTPRCNTGGCHD